MKQRFLSIILCISLLASVITGAISVSVKTAEADTIEATDTAYFMDFMDDVISVQPSMESEITEFFNLMNPYVGDTEENERKLTLMVVEGSTYIIQVMTVDSSNFYYYKRFTDKYGIAKDTSNSNAASVLFTNLGSLYVDDTRCEISYSNKSSSLWGIPSLGNYTLYNYYNTYNLAPTPGLFNREGLKFYCNKPILSGSWNISSSSANLLAGVSIRYCHLRQFTMGTRKLICLQEQNLAYAFKDDLWSTSHVEAYVVDQDSNLVQYDFRWSEMLAIDNIALYVNDVTGLGDDTTGYAWIIDEDWYSIGSFDIVYWSVDIWRHIWVTENVPFVLNQDTPEQLADKQLTEAWNTFNSYYETYNVTHVIPADLSEVLFGINGSQMYPCNISVPATVWDNSPEADGGTSAAPIHTWKWWYPSGNDVNIGFNYDLFDTVILTYSSSGEYTLIYYYDDTLITPFMAVNNLTFDQIVNQFDVVILVPDDDGCLNNTWWKTVINTVLNNLGADLPFDILNTHAIAGSGSQGIEYISSRPDANAHILQGFAILTHKAIQKQQLWNFNDGITKLYQLQVDYIDSEDKWKDSFLLWSSSVFTMLNTLDGRLSSILVSINSLSDLLENISRKLDQIAENTSEDDPGYWFISFYNWVKRWEPSNSDFANWVDSWDDFTDDIPDPGSGVTIIPFPTSIPTAAVAGG